MNGIEDLDVDNFFICGKYKCSKFNLRYGDDGGLKIFVVFFFVVLSCFVGYFEKCFV